MWAKCRGIGLWENIVQVGFGRNLAPQTPEISTPGALRGSRGGGLPAIYNCGCVKQAGHVADVAQRWLREDADEKGSEEPVNELQHVWTNEHHQDPKGNEGCVRNFLLT